MKKLISSLLALIMVMGMFSGVVLFGSGAEFDINTYVFTQLPGVQNWDEAIMTTYNELANTSGAKRVGTPASIATNNLKGAATQAIKLDLTSGKPSSDRVSFSTKGHVDDVVQSQLGDVYGDVDQLGTFCEYAGIRIAVVNENGERPSLGSLKFVIVGKESNQYGASWGNGCVPFLNYEAADASLTYVDGYYYLDFDNFTSGWGGTMREQLASGEWNWMWQYANMYIEFNGANVNTADSNGGALYISDMQLYKRVADTEGLNKLINEVEPYDVNGTYAAEIAAAKEALEANSFSGIEASKAALTAAKAALFDVNGYVKMPFGGFANFTLAEVQQFANKGGLTDITFSDLDGKNVINIANAISGQWGEVAAIWTAKTYDQWKKNELVNGKSPFDVDLSNKLGFRFKLVNTGAEGTVPFKGNINLTMGSSSHAIALDWKDLKQDENGYYTVDFSLFGKWGKQFVGTDWYTTEFKTLADTFYKKIDQTAFVFYGTVGESYSFYLDDFHAYGNANTTKLGELIQKAIGAGVAADVIDAAKTVYMNTKATQADVNAASKSLSDAMDKDLQILNAAKEELDTLIGAGYDNDAVYEANEDILLAADLVLSDTASTIDQLMFYVVELREKVALELVDEAYADILSKAFYAWESNYTKQSWASFAPALAAIWPYETATAEEFAALEAAYKALVPANIVTNDNLIFDDWTTEDVNAVVDANSGKLCDSIGTGHNGLFKDQDWNGGDFSNNTVFEAADGSFSMTTSVDLLDGSIGWKNMDRSKTLSSTGAYPTLNVAGLNECEGLRVKIDVDGYADRILIGLSNCETMMEESYALNINPESIGADGYINIPFSYFEKAFWANPISNPENAIVFIVEVYGVTANTKVTLSDVRGYTMLNYTIPTLWEYNYTAESWAAYEAAIANVKTQEDVDAAVALLVAYPTVPVTGNLFEGWTTENVNEVFEANKVKPDGGNNVADSISSDALDTQGTWKPADFTNNTTFAANNSFSITATKDNLNGTIGWKNMDRSGTLGNKTGAYPELNVKGLNDAEGLRMKIEVEGTVERLLIGLSNCATMVQESYALNIKPEYVDADGYINIPFSYFQKAWWCDAVNPPENAIVFIVEALGATEGTTITFSDVHGYKEKSYVIPELWQYNYTADSWAAYQTALESVNSASALEAALALLVPYTANAVTGNLFEGWTTENINAVVNANGEAQLKDSIGDGLNTSGVWNNGDFTNNTTFAGNNNFSMTATADFAGKSMGWKNLDRSGTLASAAMGAYPALNTKGIADANGIAFKLAVTGGTAERLLIGLSNCQTMTREMYALNIKPEYVNEDGIIYIPFTAFEKAWWCDAFAADELDNIIVFIVEAYGVSNGATITISDIHGYAEGELEIPARWEYNYTADSWAAYKAAIADAKTGADVIAAEALLVALSTSAVTGNLFEGWTDESINAVVNENGASQLKDSIGDGLNTNGVWNNGDFSNNTVFGGTDNFFMTATADFAGKSMGWKNLDRSGNLSGASMLPYPVLNGAENLVGAEGLRFKLEVTGGTAERLLIGLSNCYRGNGTREMYALNIKPEYVGKDGYINIPFTAFEKAWWTDAFAADELDEVLVFIVEAYGVSNGTTITISDVRGYQEGSLVYPEIWEYNYTAESLAAYEAAIAAAKAQFEVDAAADLLVSAPTSATTGNLFEGWTTEDVNAVVNANSDKLCDSIGNGLNEKDVWNSGDFSNNTTFAANNSFSMTATADFTGKAMGWKNMDRSKTLGGVENGAYPALNIKGLNDAEGLRFKLDVDGSVERILIGLSNCSTMMEESYAINLKAEYVDAEGYINVPFSYFQKAWWANPISDPENAIVFIIEAYGATNGTTVTISDIHGYKYFFAANEEDIADLGALADKLAAFDIDGRYADLIAEARSYTVGDDSDAVEAIYDEVMAVLEGVGDPDAAIVDVPGYSIYTQEELDQFTFCDGSGTIVLGNDGIKVTYSGKSYRFANGTYAGDGYNDADVNYGAVKAVNGKTIRDMLGGYGLDDIYAYRFKIQGGGAYVVMQYKDGVGLWNGMATNGQTAYIDGGYYTFKTSGIPTNQLDGWYGVDTWVNNRDYIRAHTNFFLADFSANQNKTIYGWQVILFETIDRSALKALLTDEANANASWYEDAMDLYYDASADQNDIDWFIEDVEFEDALAATANLWEYNYTAESWAAYEAALEAAEYAEDVEAAIALLEILEGEAVTENLFEGWTDETINAVVNANGEGQLKPSIGDGTNTGWNAGDFSLNTTFGGTDGFFMTATADFVNGSMGWKNLDRSGTLADAAMGGYPVLNDATSLVKAEGLRIKLNVTGDVERILIGLSNCQRPNGVREMYALNVKPEYVAADGYINIPFSYFEKAFWCDAFAQDELDETIVFIIEAYNVANGSTVAIEDIYGYSTKTFGAENEAKADALAAEIEAYDFLGYYDVVVADLKALSADDYYYGAMATLEEAEAANLVPAYDNLDDLKAAIQALDAELPAVVEAINVYYAPASQDAVDAAVLALTKIINTPDAPVLGVNSTDSTITVDAIAGVEYRINGGEWTTDNVFTGLAANTYHTVEARYAETATANASEITSIVMATELGSFGGASVVISGVERYLGTLTAEVIDFPEYLGSYSVVWYNAAGETVGSGAELVIDAALIGTQVYAVVTSVNATDIVTSETSGVIGKALITEYTAPTASEIQYPQLLGESVLTGGEVAGITGTWAWVTPDAQPLSSQSGSAFDVTFTPDAEFIDLYEVLEVKVPVTVNRAPFEPVEFEADGFTVSGNFMADTAITVEDITYDQAAYLALLRAASRDTSGFRNLVLFKNVDFTVNGEALDEIYEGTLTVTSFVGESRAYETVTVWFFVDGAPVSYTGTVDAYGFLTVAGVIL